MDVVNIVEKLSKFNEHWSPKLIGEMDDYHIKLAKIEGDFIWHSHADEDELFLVIAGRFRMDYRDSQKWIETGEMVIVPKGVEHKPFAEIECSVLLIEKSSVDHTGGVDDPRRIDNPERV